MKSQEPDISYIDDEQSSAPALPEPAADDVFVFPASYAQRRLWFLDQFEPGSPYYNIPLAFRLKGPLNLLIFKRAIDEVISRHESLRTTFASIDGEPMQLVAPSLQIPAPIIDLSGKEETSREQEILRLATVEARKPFDLAKGPLLRVTVLKAAANDHVVLACMHHIISDGWSMGVLIMEITTLYGALLAGQSSPLPELPIQYGDFSEWQKDYLQGETLQKQLAFWQEHVGSNPPALELPTDRPRPLVQTNAGSSIRIGVPRETADKLLRLAHQEGATLFMALLAAFKTLLYRYSGQPDVCVGTPIANRNRKEIEGLIGIFINTLVLRTQFYDNPSFRELIRRVRQGTLDSYDNQDLPFELLVDKLQPNRDMSYSPIFQVMFILQNAPVKFQNVGVDLRLEMIDVDMGTSTFDLTMSIAESPAGLNVAVEYNSDLFDRSTVIRFLQHYKNLLTAIPENPDQRLSLLPVLSDEETNQILYTWNDTRRERDCSLRIHDIFEKRVHETPDADAVVFLNDRLTYRQLNERANRLAHYLQMNGVGPETVVGVLHEKHVDLMTAVLGVLKAGGAYLPMDPTYPEDRLQYMLEDGQAPVVIIQESFRSVVQHYSGRVISLEGDAASIAAQSTADPVSDVDAENLAYMIYTSGSTGKSKGTMVRHRGLVNVYLAWEEAYELRTTARNHLQMASFSFDVFSGDWTRALCSGGKLVLVPRDMLLQADQLYDYMRREEVNTAEFVPAVLRNLIQYLDESGNKLDFFRNLIAGSDIWYVNEYKNFQRFIGPQTRLINSFGLTEATIDSSWFERRDLNMPGDRLVPIGKPFANMSIFLLDEYFQPTPIGVRGELYVGGDSLARGYFKRPDLTAERFIPNPFAASDENPKPPVIQQEPSLGREDLEDERLKIKDQKQTEDGVKESRHMLNDTAKGSYGMTFGKDASGKGEALLTNPSQAGIASVNNALPQHSRLYRTGDMARYLPDGNIEFLGRADTQVKLRGFRIELGEIEIALGMHEALKDAVVVLREDRPDDKRLVAYFVPAEGREPGVGELRKFLAEKLPEYMIPSAFIWLDKLPLTPNGKVDRRVLPKPDPELFSAELEAEYVAPRTPTEEVLSGIFAKILNVEKAGAFHNFFELGGHSLLATQLISRIKENFKVELPLRNVFESPTIVGLAMAVDKAKLAGKGLAAPPILPVSREQELPLSFAQQRLWFLDQLEPNSAFYNIPENYLVDGPLDPELLKQAVNELIRRHESLRTTFHSRNGQPWQQIHRAFDVQIPVTDLTAMPADQRNSVTLNKAREIAARPIAIDRLPLFNMEALKFSGGEHAIVLSIHHIISDNWSTQVMMAEIALLYDAFMRNEPQPLPELPAQYADFAFWQRNWLQGEVLEKQIAYWKKQLDGLAPALELPLDRPRPAMQTFNGSYKTFHLSPELSAGLKKVAKDSGATEFMMLLAAFQVLLSRYSNQTDIAVGAPIANRNRGELERLIGFFVNTLVMRSDLSGNPSFSEVLRRVRETALGAYAHQDLPFEKIVDALQPERNMSHPPLFQVMFTMQSGQARQMRRPHSALSLRSVDAHSGTSKFDLTLFMLENEGHFSGAFEFNTDLFDEATIDRMINHFNMLLQGVAADPQQPVNRIRLMQPDEYQRLISDWNRVTRKHHFDEPLPVIFEKQARAFAGAPALSYCNHTFTYAELNAKTNQLAHFLISRGIRPDMLVGVSIERSPEMVIALLATLKAGAAYVPVDPNYPKERLRYILADSGVKILLSTEKIAAGLPPSAAETICLDRDAAQIAAHPAENPPVSIDPENLAYMIYTSGSTGKPKGAMINHRGLTNYLNWCYFAYPLQEGRGSLVHATIAFDATVTSVFTPILTGKTITLIPDDADLEELGKELRRQRDFNIVKITPAHLEMLGRQIPLEEAAGLTDSFIIGGENLTAGQIAFWQANAPQTKLFNEYGPTETVVGCVVFEAAQWRGSGSVPIGRVISNTRIYVLDEDLQPVPQGLPGELYIAGHGVARGYLNRPDLTADKFLPDPFCRGEALLTNPEQSRDELANNVLPASGVASPLLGARMYKTGDLVRWQNDGNLIFLGRIDSQVKIRGYRIELGEIESALKQHEQVRDAAVIVREDTPGDKRLAAYLVMDPESGAAELRQFLSGQLPDYMVPAFYVNLPEIPLTPNGKVDRRALPRPDYTAVQGEQEFIAPRTPEEEMLAAIWREILQLERIGVYDNFFAVGGHSLLATQVTARIRDSFGVELPLTRLFEAPTIAALLQHIETARLESAGIAAPPLGVAPDRENLPLSFAQQRLWFLDQLAPNNPFYNIPAALRLTGQLDLATLERSINEIIRRHEALRTSFLTEKGQARQVISPDLHFRLPVTDLSGLNENQRRQEAMRLANEDALKPFKLDEAPLFRASLLHLSDTEHIILFNLHHIISDGWSSNVLMREVAVIYHAFSQNLPSPLPELPLQYADYAAWQRGWLKDDVLQKQLDYWKETLGINPPPLNLPTERPRPPVQTFNGNVYRDRLSAELSQAVRQFSQKHGATIFMTLLAAFQTLLHRYSQQDEIIVGSPIANRTHSELEGLIGFFVNSLALRADFDDDPTFTDLLSRTRRGTLGAYAHQDVPFEQLVDLLQSERNMSHSPLFQVMFVLQNTPGRGVDMPGLRMEGMETESKIAKFDLTLMAVEDPSGFGLEFEYNTDLFEASGIAAMNRRFTALLQNLLENPGLPVSQYALMTGTEQDELIRQSQYSDTPFPDSATIHQLFENRVQRTPDKTAVVFGEQRLTFNELNRRANRLAHLLREKGIGPERLVGISVERSLEMVIALLGVLKAGGVYAPIDPSYPDDRIDYIIQDSGISLLLTQQALAEKFSGSRAEIFRLDTDWSKAAAQPDENPPNLSHPENLAYLIYTSGSTGRPKGTMLQHRGLCNLTMAQIKDFQLDEDSRCLQFASFSFDASVSEIFTTLISGATLYLASRGQLMPGPELVQLLKENRISVVTLPPSVSGLLRQESFPDLKTLVSAGEACPPEIAAHWSAGRRFLNAYGPTENTVCASSLHVTDAPHSATIPIGKAIDNVQLYILDIHARLTPPGLPGELCIGGSGLARGYWNRPDLTAEKFIPNPFIDDLRLTIDDLKVSNSLPLKSSIIFHQSTIINRQSSIDNRLYRTGDLARLLPDGNIEFLGRIDEQVKVRGFRIEPGEIEQVLSGHPAVESVVVIAREDVPGDQRLVAYFTVRSGQEVEIPQLREAVKNRLPEYMHPAAYLQLAEMPLTTNGKINRRQLPRPEYGRDVAGQEFIAPRNAAEEMLADIWREILHLDKVGVHQNFFEIGGHSLLATQAASRIRDAFGVELPLIRFFEAPNIAALALEIEQQRIKQSPIDAIPLAPADRSQPLLLSFAQQRLWFLDQLAPQNASYNIPMAMRITGRFEIPAFQDALNALVARHESLRTTFKNINGQPVQVISPPLPADLEILEITKGSASQKQADARAMASEDAMEPFDLETGPLFRAKLLKLGPDDYVVLFNMHHIISDGWSMNILVQEFSRLYEACGKGNSALAGLSELPVQYADFAAWQRRWLTGEALQRQIDYWKEQIGLNPEPLNLPLDKPRPAIQTFVGATESQTLSADLSDQIRQFATRQGVTLFMMLLAAFQTLLRRYTNQDSVLVGSPIANRTRSETEKLIGFFVNNLALKADFSGNPDFTTLLSQIRQTTLQAYAHQDLPFEQLVEILQPERDMSHSPIFQTVFVLQNIPMGALSLSDVRIEPVQSEQRISKFDLTLIMMDTPEGLLCEFEYNTDLFEAATIRSLLTNFSHLLQRVIAQPTCPIDALPLLAEAERKQVLYEWNRTAAPFPSDLCIHQLFEQAAQQYPKHPALELDNRELSYRELNKRANQMAHYLRSLGIGPDMIVGVCLERSFEMIIAMLGALKAGAAYLPIDPTYPQDRIQYIVSDSGISAIITDAAINQQLSLTLPNIILSDRDARRIASASDGNPVNKSCPTNLAYVIYTSGSTGRPKGTLLQHTGLVNLARAYQKLQPVTHASRTLQFASFSFDASVEEIFTALTAGATLVLIKRETILSGAGLIETMRRKKITNITLPPSVLQVLTNEKFPGLATIISAGEACTPALTRHWAGKYRFFNGYGPTENTVCTTMLRVPETVESRSVPIGKPITNHQCYILDRYLNPLPAGIPGEICVGGVALARGYLNRPDLTADKFIPNPFIDDCRLSIDDLTTPNSVHQSSIETRLYRTGDLARWLPNGNIEFLGRIDEQVKIRGFRVELGEIESVILQDADISNAVVTVRKFAGGESRLVAYVVGRGPVNTEKIYEALRRQLADYMTPSAIVTLDSLPLTPNGKVDYRALPLPPDTVTKTAEFVAPRTAFEARLAELWQQTLNAEKISVTANFFELGGHSLLAMKLLTAVEQQFHKDINLVDFFQQPTIERMAEMLTGEKSAKSTLMLLPLRKGSEQEPLYFIHPSGGAVHHYQELSGLLDTTRAVYGIQAEGLNGQVPMHRDIAEMASAYLNEIMKKQPQGPYHLVGWSLGVIIVHEMTRQLEQMAQKPGLIIHLDQGPFIERIKPADNAEMLANMFQRYFKTDIDALRKLDEEEQFTFIIKRAKKHKVIPRFIRLADFKRYIVVNETQLQAWMDYQPGVSGSDVWLFRSEDSIAGEDPLLGWPKLVSGRIVTIDVPGNHITMLQQPHVTALAEKLGALLKNSSAQQK